MPFIQFILQSIAKQFHTGEGICVFIVAVGYDPKQQHTYRRENKVYSAFMTQLMHTKVNERRNVSEATVNGC
jgi:hypothetical protein